MLRIKLLTAAMIAVLSFGTLQAQEVEAVKDIATTVETVAKASEAVSATEIAPATSVSLNEEGKLVGNAFVAGEETPLEAKVTIAGQDGVVIDTVVAQEDGSFAFTSIAPGSYNMYGSAAGYVGAQAFDVGSYSSGGCSSCDLGMTSYSPSSYESYSSAPVSSCGSCGGCGGGCGGGGLFGGGGGGGLLSSRFFRLGAIGGVIAIAASGDDETSPDN